MTVTPAPTVDERPSSRAIARTVFIGVLRALLAIPGAATIQIALREYLDYKGMLPRRAGTDAAIPAA